MLPTYTVKANGARYRYYASRPNMKGERSRAAISRIPAPAFESFLAGVVARLSLPSIDQSNQFRAAIHRIEVQASAIVLRLDRAHVINYWREQNPDSAREPEADILAGCRAALATGDTLHDHGNNLVLTLPVRAIFGRHSVRHSAMVVWATFIVDFAQISPSWALQSWPE